MKTIFLIMASGGEYSDHWSQPIKALTTEAAAKIEIARLESVTDELRKLRRYPAWDQFTRFRELGLDYKSQQAADIRTQWQDEYAKIKKDFELACEKADIPPMLMQDSNLSFDCTPLLLVTE